MQNKGFFGSLFDLSFTSLVTTRIIKVLYVLAIIVIGLYALVFVVAGFHSSAGAGLFVLLIAAPFFALVSLIYTRVLLEVLIALFRIMENTGQLVAHATPLPASAPPSAPQVEGAPSQRSALRCRRDRCRPVRDGMTVLAAQTLRPGLLEGLSVVVAGPSAPLGTAVAKACGELGAQVSTCEPESEDEVAIDHAIAQVGAIDMLVVDGAALFGDGAPTALRTCLDSAWNVTRAVVNHAFLPAAEDSQIRRIVYLAPAANAGPHADAARAGLENLARTLSVEWARHAINAVAIAPGGRESHPSTAADEVATLTAYLASPAGDYFSGCLLELG